MIQLNYIQFKIKSTFHIILNLNAAIKRNSNLSAYSPYIIYLWSVPTHFPPGTYFLITCIICKTFFFFTKVNINDISITKFIFMSVGWDVKWCPVSRITPLARKRPFHWISMKSKLVRATRETSKFQN